LVPLFFVENGIIINMSIQNWFSADLHLGHDNILSLCNRPFSTIQEMADVFVSNHNSLVKENDIYWNFGDIGFRCSPQYLVSQISRLHGKFIVILGNHDKPFRQAVQLGLLNKELNSRKIQIVGGMASIHDREIAISKMIDIEGQKIFISHYSHRTWPGAFRGSYHLFGHSHDNLSPLYKSFDVGVDANGYFPISFSQIKQRMDLIIDQFKENDNENNDQQSE